MNIINSDIKLDFEDVLICPKRSTLNSRSEVDLEKEFKFKWHDKKWKGIPIMASNMDATGTFEMAKSFSKYNMLVAIHKHYSIEDWEKNHEFVRSERGANTICVTTGIQDLDFEKLLKIMQIYPNLKWICIDVANGYTSRFEEFVKKIRKIFPDKILIAGNVVTREMTEQLLLSGADIVKIGIGNGSVCTTRKMTGVGYPQLSAIMECADAAHGLNGHILCDGGCQFAGDIAKALGAGADFIMLGGMFAGHDESAGEIKEKHFKTGEINDYGKEIIKTKKFKLFYGMSSETAMHKYKGGIEKYRASEGKTTLIPYKGLVENTILEILGGLRSACTYAGSKKLKDFPKCTTFIRVSKQHNDMWN